MWKLSVVLMGCILGLLAGFGLSFAQPVAITVKPVTLNLQLVDTSLVPVVNVRQLGFIGGLEYRNTTSNAGMIYPAAGDSSIIDGVFVVDSMKDANGTTIVGTGLNDTWEMTATYTALSDVIFAGDAAKFSYSTAQQKGVLTFYVSTDMTKRATQSTGQGYDDGTMVAQYAVYNPDPATNNTSGGVVNIIAPFDGARDLLMTRQSGLSGFITSTNDPSEEITALLTDSNLEADNNNDGIPANSPSVPTMWNYPLDAPAINFPFDFFAEADGSFRFGTVPVPPPGSCRMTGGGNDVNGNIVLGTLANSLDDRYTYGGQIGAPTADQPQPYGEWTHHQQSGPGDKFVFHSGTASAPKATRIIKVFCQDPCNCVQARPAPFKQISWDGIGAFKNISPAGLKELNRKCPGVSIVPGRGGSLHYYRVHVNDTGEPGSGGQTPVGNGKKSTLDQCDLVLGPGFPKTPYEITDAQCKNCSDTYQIEIRCTDQPDSKVMYSIGAFVEGGNLQIHPPVGEHMNPGQCP